MRRVTFRGRPKVRKAAPKASKAPPTRQKCEACEWFNIHRSKCVHPFNGRPCNPARVEPWKWGMGCPVS